MVVSKCICLMFFFFFQAEDGIRDYKVTGVQTCALPISSDTEEPAARELGDDLRVAAAVPLVVEAIAGGKVAEDGFRLQRQGFVPERDVDRLPLEIQVGTVELRFPADPLGPRVAQGKAGGLARGEVQAPVERPRLAERKERLRFGGERRPPASVRAEGRHGLR